MGWTVYCHTFPNGKKYVGITSQSVENRWGNGSGYMNGKQPLMQKAINKYGWDNVKHEIISTQLTQEEANELEIKLIQEWQLQNPKFGYNCRAGGNVGKWSESSKQKLSISRKNFYKEHPERKINPFKGKKHTELQKQKIGKGVRLYWENHPDKFNAYCARKKGRYRQILLSLPRKYKPVLCIETGTIYNSVKEAVEKTKINQTCISHCCNGQYQTAGGYHWKFI